MLRTFVNTLFCIVLCCVTVVSAAQEKAATPVRLSGFDRAIAFIEAYRNDSARIMLTQLNEQLATSESLHTPFGLEVRLRQAEIQEKTNEDKPAYQELLSILEESQTQDRWGTYAHAHVILARLHEKHSRWERCKFHLDQASQTIQTHAVDSIAARLYMRTSSYFRQQ
jgi:hypothetical protein